MGGAVTADGVVRVLVTGSRNWTNADAVAAALDAASIEHPGFVLVHGGAVGADRIAGEWAARRGEPAQVFPYPRGMGRRGGPVRNQRMVDLGPVLCLAFIGHCTNPSCGRPMPHGSHGASGCADMAEKAGIKTLRYGPS